MVKMAMYFPYTFKENYRSGTALVKIWFGERFFIWKAKAVKQTADQVCRDISRKVRLGCPETDLFYQVCRYIKRGRILSCTFEVIIYCDDHERLFEIEKEELKKYFGTKECLNISAEPYRPGWLSMSQNKAPGSTIDPAPVRMDAPEVKIKPGPLKTIPVAKIPSGDTGKKQTVEKMKELMKLRNAKV
jgi:hypothetical protein